MKKKFLGLVAIGVIAAVAAWNVSRNMNETAMSDTVLENVEALAEEINPACPNGCVANGNGCDCNGWWPCYDEAKW
jgi:hypothetical protein